jgi:hypothetical protein
LLSSFREEKAFFLIIMLNREGARGNVQRRFELAG